MELITMNIKQLKMLAVLFVSSLMLACSSESGDDDYTEKMAKEHEGETPVANASADYEPRMPVETETVEYATVDGNTITGYMAKAEEADRELPGIIVIQEWWGLNDNIRMMTRRLAGEGYAALAVDLYSGNVADNSQDARKYMSQVNSENTVDNLKQARQFLADQTGSDDIGVIGWCFGGGWSLQSALAMPDKIDATVIYYGRLVNDKEKLQKLDMPILGIFGAEDRGIPPEQVKEFESQLKDLGKTVDVNIYEGAGHAFANPSGERYNEDAAKDAWEKTVAFFNENLK